MCKSGTGTLNYLTAYRYRLPGNQPGQLNRLLVTRYIRPANRDQIPYKQGLYAPDEPLKVPAGQVFDIGLEIITDHPVDHLAITDQLPAGFEAVDTSFQTAIASLQAQQDSWQIGYQQIYRDKVVATRSLRYNSKLRFFARQLCQTRHSTCVSVRLNLSRMSLGGY